MPAIVSVLALGLTLTLAPPQEVASPATPVSADTLGGPQGSVAAQEGSGAQATSSGLPRRPVPPRTMEAHWPVFVFFAVTWVGIIGYLLVTGKRAARLARRLHELEER